MRIKYLIGILSIIFLVILFHRSEDGLNERVFLFREDEIIHTNIARLEIIDFRVEHDVIVLENLNEIENISSFLRKVNSDNTHDMVERNDQPIYHINIANIGRNGNPLIAVYEDTILYKAKEIDLTTEELSTLNQLVNEIRK